ncbi:MAG: Elongation factor Ts [Parcubacteria group bacterium GW2011_GWD2_38_12]|nr:MAG: Elongation factor Ts [Parcubacteria group bacterium GW2011_GWC2_36_17]KKQ40517.1 MAG: Elongation factor Ts [Candidatus Moranbacteria bacterium GW2011_GWF2_37_7]KKQ43454.1 MAG: Elongation factor Ts [Parcubacteria group bacterium GW2011_GWE2_37_8]KKQ52307.1 MAG: Elongation factor Ts [Parcubacteria group bacterium GW2011_GWD2_38_12]KKQ58592.1 MAG: Elongation factor Ts [Parcubacteria group bacterium GW2011_GWC1_38_17]KKQ58692.1 MAG: Elongation factor Ts [Parcubacteria group bacterium GW201
MIYGMAISIEQIQNLRVKTGSSILDCKKALEESNGDEKEAIDILKKRGRIIAEKKGVRATSAGIIDSYIHPNKRIGVLIELRCETDFVAKNSDFINLTHELAMHIAAMSPKYLKPEDIPQEILDEERNIFMAQVADINKPANIKEEMVDGKMKKRFSEICLFEQPFVKNPNQTTRELITEYIAKIGENIEVARFTRYEL